jgi:hypothetical protein
MMRGTCPTCERPISTSVHDLRGNWNQLPLFLSADAAALATWAAAFPPRVLRYEVNERPAGTYKWFEADAQFDWAPERMAEAERELLAAGLHRDCGYSARGVNVEKVELLFGKPDPYVGFAMAIAA